MTDPRPIAVLDTGVGGLSVVAALRALVPSESIYYFADTAHLPYGLKSPQLIKSLGLTAARTLMSIAKPKMLVIACHTISVWCLKELELELDIPVVGMLQPSIEGLKKLVSAHNYRSLGVISTSATLQSGAYRHSWSYIDPDNKTFLLEQACGPLVSLVEEGLMDLRELTLILDGLLHDSIKKTDALLIGCTHFSALVPALRALLTTKAHIIDAADLVAAYVKEQITADILAPVGFIKGYVSDNPERFLRIVPYFLKESMSVEDINAIISDRGSDKFDEASSI